jgi:MFS-type transporter involved in bile tolerance (Atg22 family)
MVDRKLQIRMLPPGPRRFLAFNFINVLSWTSLLGTVLVLHATALGISSAAIGALNSILNFACILGIFTKTLAERIGSKRLLLGGWTLRNLMAAPIVLVPLVRRFFGFMPAAVLLFACITLFCIARALSNIAWASWLHEIVPPKHLGRYYTVESVMTRVLMLLCGVVCFLVFSGSSSTPSPDNPDYAELWRFAAISGFGVTMGLVSTRVLRNVPGGMPPEPDARGEVPHASFRAVLHDRMFLSFLLCSAFFSSLYTGAAVMIPLLLRLHFKLGTGTVLLLTSLGNLLAVATTPRWRRVADRHGSPVTMLANGVLFAMCMGVFGLLAYLRPARAPLWILFPICALVPVADSGNAMATSRGFMLRVTAENRHACNAIWNAGTQTLCGTASIATGLLLRGGDAGMHLRYASVAWCFALLMLATGWFALRVRVPEGDAQPGPSPIYNPAHPLQSIYRIIPYVLAPRRGDPLASERVDHVR